MLVMPYFLRRSDLGFYCNQDFIVDYLPLPIIWNGIQDWFNDGVTGQNSPNLVWDISSSYGMYYLVFSDEPPFYGQTENPLTIFVASELPITITVQETFVWGGLLPLTVGACVGDILSIENPIYDAYSPTPPSSVIHEVVCFSKYSCDDGIIVFSGITPFSFTADSTMLGDDKQCLIRDISSQPNNLITYALLFIYPRPHRKEECVQCPIGSTSTSGAHSCTTLAASTITTNPPEPIIPVSTTSSTTPLLTTSTPFPTSTTPLITTTTPLPTTSAPLSTTCLLGSYYNTTTNICSNCPSGKYSSVKGATACVTCDLCLTGQYILSTCNASTNVVCDSCSVCPSLATTSTTCLGASTADTVTCKCQPGYYGFKGLTCSQCPPHTNSTANASSSLLDCICFPGYTCAYKKKINVVIRIKNMTLASFYSNNYNLTFMNAVAKAANVNVSMVNLVSVVLVDATTGAVRRLLSKHHHQHLVRGTGDLVLTWVVHDAEEIDPQAVAHHHSEHALLLLRSSVQGPESRSHDNTTNRLDIDFTVSWEPSHGLDVLPSS